MPSRQTDCCVIGAGPAGVLLSLLLVRQGVNVVLLEQHHNLERDFRGDTLHPVVLEILEQLGLIEEFLALPQTRMQQLEFHCPAGRVVVSDLKRIRTNYPFVTIIPQASFLKFLIEKADAYPNFQFLQSTKAVDLRCEGEAICGIQAKVRNGDLIDISAKLTVAADGRRSTIRKLAGMQIQSKNQGIDVLWFRVPRMDSQIGGGYLGPGGYMIALRREEEWQLGYVIGKDQYAVLRDNGIAEFRQRLQKLAPDLSDSFKEINDWSSIKKLSVEAGCLKQWHRTGLLLIGDAAHPMSPVGGVGINIAIQDAVAAANVVTKALLSGTMNPALLGKVRRRRRWVVRLVQRLQAFDQKFLIQPALKSSEYYRLPLWLRILLAIPVIRNLPTYLLAFGGKRVRISRSLVSAAVKPDA